MILRHNTCKYYKIIIFLFIYLFNKIFVISKINNTYNKYCAKVYIHMIKYILLHPYKSIKVTFNIICFLLNI